MRRSPSTIGVRELRQNLSVYLRRVKAGGDLLALGPPLGRQPTRRASRALDELRRQRRWR